MTKNIFDILLITYMLILIVCIPILLFNTLKIGVASVCISKTMSDLQEYSYYKDLSIFETDEEKKIDYEIKAYNSLEKPTVCKISTFLQTGKSKYDFEN